jgi:2'-5' RNA ligase
MPRLFTGLEIPPGVAADLAFLRGGLVGARWIEPENYHITLRFLGDVEQPVAEEFALELARIRRRPFEVTVEGLDFFGGERPRAVIAKVRPGAALVDLQGEHERIARRVGLAPETRKFVPHVTLARLRAAAPLAVADYMNTSGFFPPREFTAERFVLYSARASTGGGPYLVEADYPFVE